VADHGPSGDPGWDVTRRADINPHRPQGPPAAGPPTGSYPEVNPAEDEPPPPTPWYRKRAVLIAWGLVVLALIALIVYALIDLSGRGAGGPTPTPTTTTTLTTSTTTTTTESTTTESPSPSTAPEEPAPGNEPPEAPAPVPHAPPPRPAPPSHRHHLPKLPPTISVPGGPVITVPPGLH
jgi:hypothetical protein